VGEQGTLLRQPRRPGSTKMVENTNVQSRTWKRWVAFLLFWASSLIPFYGTLRALITLSLRDDRYTYIVVIPLISAVLIYLGRDRISRESRTCYPVALPALLFGLALFWIAEKQSTIGRDVGFCIEVFGIFLVWLAGFVLFHGLRSLRLAIFPVCFLVLITPLPAVFLDQVVLALQKGSAEISFVLFKLAGVPVFRQGLTFSLPGVDISVAEQCSGIRSSASLLIASMLMGHVLLRSGWSRIWLTLFTIPVVIFKNAVRIVTISWLGIYVNADFFHGRLHHQGGLPFSLLALAIMGSMLFVLHRAEVSRREDFVLEALGKTQP